MKKLFNRIFGAILVISILSLSLSGTYLNAQNYNDAPNSSDYLAGVKAFDASSYDDALKSFTDELKVHPKNGFAWFYVGQISYAKDEWTSAETAFDNACKFIPREEFDWLVRSYCNSGCSKMALDKWEEAADTYDKEVSIAILSDEGSLKCRAYLDRALFTTIATFYNQAFMWEEMVRYIERDLESATEYSPSRDQMYQWFTNIVEVAAETENYSEDLARDYTKIREVVSRKSSDAAKGINDAWKDFVDKGKEKAALKATQEEQATTAKEKEEEKATKQNNSKKVNNVPEEVLAYTIAYTIVAGKPQVDCSIDRIKQPAIISKTAKGVMISPFTADILAKRGIISASKPISEGQQFTVNKFFIGNVNFGTMTVTVAHTGSRPIEIGEDVLAKLGTVKINSAASRIEIYTKKQ